MNNESPLIPQGSLLEQKNKGRARVKIAVFVVLAIHGLGLMALLMQGCGNPKEANPPLAEITTNAAPQFEQTTNQPIAPPETNTPPVMVQTNTSPTPPEVPVMPPTVTPAGTGTEYSIAKGDTIGALAKKFHVTVNAIKEANPGVEPTKLKIGQKLVIPAASAGGSTAAGGGAGTTGAGEGQTYTVKSGDSLTKIASQFGTTVKAIRAANSLKTDKIRVGQQLKVPAKAGGSAAASGSVPPPLPGPEAGTSGSTGTPATPAR